MAVTDSMNTSVADFMDGEHISNKGENILFSRCWENLNVMGGGKHISYIFSGQPIFYEIYMRILAT